MIKYGESGADILYLDLFLGCAKTFWGPRCAWRCFCAEKIPCQVYLGICPDNKCVDSHMGQFCETGTLTSVLALSVICTDRSINYSIIIAYAASFIN